MIAAKYQQRKEVALSWQRKCNVPHDRKSTGWRAFEIHLNVFANKDLRMCSEKL